MGAFNRMNAIHLELDESFNLIMKNRHIPEYPQFVRFINDNIQQLAHLGQIRIEDKEHKDNHKELFYHIFRWLDRIDYSLREDEDYKIQINNYILLCNEISGFLHEYRGHKEIDFSPFLKWVSKFDKARTDKHRIPSWAGILYIHQRITQLFDFIELYDNLTDKDIITRRFLFERGLKQLKIDKSGYLKKIFLTSDLFLSCNFYSRHVLYHLCFKSSFGIPRIDWVDDESEKKILQKELFKGVKYAELAYRKKRRKGSQATILEPYVMSFFPKPNEQTCKKIHGRFHLQRNFNGFIGYRKDKKTTTIILGYSGTEPKSLNNWWTNFKQYLGFLDVVYVTASGLLYQLWDDKLTKNGFQNAKIRVYGHSLGGGLMQFAVSALYKEKEMSRNEVFGYGYNSAGLSAKNVKRVFSAELKNICHLHLKGDIVFKTPFAYQLGKSINVGELSMLPLTAHSLDTIRECNPDLETKNNKAFLAR